MHTLSFQQFFKWTREVLKNRSTSTTSILGLGDFLDSRIASLCDQPPSSGLASRLAAGKAGLRTGRWAPRRATRSTTPWRRRSSTAGMFRRRPPRARKPLNPKTRSGNREVSGRSVQRHVGDSRGWVGGWGTCFHAPTGRAFGWGSNLQSTCVCSLDTASG